MATRVRCMSESVLPTIHHNRSETNKRPNLNRNATTYSILSGYDGSKTTKNNWYKDVNNELLVASTRTNKHENVSNNRLSFLDLPAELRLQIYHLIFHEAKMRLVYGDLVDGNKTTPMRGLNFPNGILQTCKLIRNEAMPVLQQSVILQVNWAPNYAGERLELDIAPAWRDRIQYAHFASLREALLRLDKLVGLKEVVIGYHLYNCAVKHRTGVEEGKEDEKDLRIQQLSEVRIAKRAFLTEAVDGLKIKDNVRIKMLLHVHGPRATEADTRRLLIDVRK